MENKFFSKLREIIGGLGKYYIIEGEVEDVIQEVAVLIVEKGQHERLNEEDLNRWAFQVAKHKLGNHFKARKREKERFVAIEETIEEMLEIASLEASAGAG